jgi:hypothetical protein|tara:strand:+ start:623 stop:853 length:231 start_codon:yes stop_codon:yes gene_type:complete
MSIGKIKETATKLKEGKLLSFLKTSGSFGYDNPYNQLSLLFNLIEAYEEPKPVPKIDTPPKTRRTRKTVKKEESIE